MSCSKYDSDDEYDEVDFAVVIRHPVLVKTIESPTCRSVDPADSCLSATAHQLENLTLSVKQESHCTPVVVPSQLTPQQKHDQLLALRVRCFKKNEDGDSYLHLSTIYEIPDDVRKLIFLAESISLIDDTNNLYQTPLVLAVLVRNAAITRMLVCAGADTLKVDMRGNTALHIACELKELEIIENLLRELDSEEKKQWSDVLPYQSSRKPLRQVLDALNYRGFTPIHIAYFSNHKEGLLMLLKYGGNINSMDQCSRKTVLHFAVEEQNLDMVRFLVEQCGADVNAMTAADYTALDIAHYCRNSFLIEYLESKDAHLSKYNSDSSCDDDDDDDDESEMDLSEDEEYDDIKINLSPRYAFDAQSQS